MLLMKLITFFLVAGFMQVHAAAFAQGEQVAFPEEKLTVEQVFSTVRKQLGYAIFYNNEELDATRQVQLPARQLSLDEVMKEVLGGGYAYEVIDKTIVISPVRAKQVERLVITGTVRDEKGVLLPGVSVVLKGSTLGVATDTEGKFILELPRQDNIVLVFSFVGMETKEVAYRGEQRLDVVLAEAREELGEVVITGYQRIDKRESTSAVSVIKADDLKTIGATSIEQMLQGQLPGLSVVNTSAGPGATPKIRVRGTATIAGNADPLWVLDGVILENSVPLTVADLNSPDVMTMFNSAIGGISPNDIESITVLKDASATAIYGTRAANGVIVVTTKKGARNGFNINFQHTSTVTLRPTYRNFDLLDSKERIMLSQQIVDEGLGYAGPVGLEYLLSQYIAGNMTLEEMETEAHKMEERNTDWFDILYRNAYSQTYNLSVSGGSDKADYYASLSYNNEQGVDKVSDYKEFGGFMKVNAELFKGVKFGATLQVGRRDRNSYWETADPFKYAVRTARTIPLHDEDGNLFFYRNSDIREFDFNILHEQENTHKESTQTDVKGIVNLEIDLYKGLKYNGLYSYASSHSAAIDWATEESAYIAEMRGYNFGEGTEEMIEATSIPYGGMYNETDYEQRTSLIRNNLEYRGTVAEELTLDAMIGQEFRTTVYRGGTVNAWGYMHNRGNIFYNPAEGEDTGHILRNTFSRDIPERSNISYYGVFSAMYKNRYVLNANVRFDGSNLFGSNPKYRYLPLWSVSGKWIVSNEGFMRGMEKINNLALRASYGLRGNIVEESSPQLIASALPPNEFTSLMEIEIIQAPNPDLKWETTSSLNIGLELNMFESRLALDVDYYRDYSHNLIAYKQVSAVTGFLNKNVNYADVRNQGVDIALSGTIIKTKNVSWQSTINLGYVKNKVTKSYITPQASSLVKSTYTPGEVMKGYPSNGMFSYRFAGLDEDGAPLFYDENNNKLGKDDANFSSAIYTNLENLKYEGPRDPVLTGGFNNIVKYKNLTFSALFAFGLKNVVRLPNVAFDDYPRADENMNRTILNRWQKPGDEATKRIPGLTKNGTYISVGDSEGVYITEMYNNSTETVVPGDYLRLRNVMVEYRFPSRWMEKIAFGDRKLGGIVLKLQAQNVFVIANKRLKGYDPETVNYSTTGYGSLPLQRSITLGLNINF